MNGLILDVITTMLVPVLLALLVIWIASRFGKLSVTAKKWWLFAHVMCAVIYFSGLFGTLLLALSTKFTTDSQQIYSAHQFIHFFDWFLIIPGAATSLITGLVLAVRTNWGLTQYYWVMAKWIGNIGGITFGGTAMRHWIHEPFANIPASVIDPLQSPAYVHNRQLLFLGLAISFALLLFLSAISYLKPWGKRKQPAAALNRTQTTHWASPGQATDL